MGWVLDDFFSLFDPKVDIRLRRTTAQAIINDIPMFISKKLLVDMIKTNNIHEYLKVTVNIFHSLTNHCYRSYFAIAEIRDHELQFSLIYICSNILRSIGDFGLRFETKDPLFEMVSEIGPNINREVVFSFKYITTKNRVSEG